MAWKILGSWALMTMRLAILFREFLLGMGGGKGNVFAIFFFEGIEWKEVNLAFAILVVYSPMFPFSIISSPQESGIILRS